MSLLSRLANVFHKRRLQRELTEELEDHIENAMKNGRSREEAERALGSLLRHREASTDIKIAVWLDSLKADAIFGYRQLKRRPAVTLSAVFSLALAIGAVTAAFRLIDAVLLRPLPVTDPASLHAINYININEVTGKADESASFSYPLFKEFQAAAKDKAELMVVSYANRTDITFASDNEMERAYRQYVSGNFFSTLGLRPALGRLLAPADDATPGAHPQAVISHDYWTRRFARSPAALGKTFRAGTILYEIIGVSPDGFTGTEPGTMTDYFIPAMQNADAIANPNWQWMRILLRVLPGGTVEQVQQPIQATMIAHRRLRAKAFPADTPKPQIDRFINAAIVLPSAAAGASTTQKNYRQPLLILAVIVLLVLLIACANVANLLTAQATAREREMALRVSIGAGRSRLVQLMIVECALLAFSATALGALFAWWSAPFVVSMINPAGSPVRLDMPADWRVLAFAFTIAFSVTILFGLAPALRASAVKPASALKGGDDPHSRRRLMNALVAAQVAFCFLVHFVAGLFVASFQRLSTQPTGFAVERVLLLETVVKGPAKTANRDERTWEELAGHLRTVPGVQSVAFSGWGLMSGSAWTGSVRVPNVPLDPVSPYFFSVSPGWLDQMEIRRIDGRDFRPGELPGSPERAGVAIVNEAFARKYFNGQNPVGKTFDSLTRGNVIQHVPIVGYVRDARYDSMREPIRPTVYVPLGERAGATFAIRTASPDPLGLAVPLRRLVTDSNPDFRVSNVSTQLELVQNQTIRERLLATLSLFFATVALLLASVGLYGVLNFAVLQRRREIGIRMALGARAAHVARHVTFDVFLMLILGSALGVILGLLSERFIESLLFDVKATNPALLAIPIATLFLAALLATLPPVLAATRTDPSTVLRAD
jgi:predicted permease